MHYLLLEKWKKNDVFKAVQKAGLDPNEFDFKNTDDEVWLKHRWSKSFFIIGGDIGNYVGSYATGDGPDCKFEIYSWQTLIDRISRWLEELKRDLETPDLWNELQNKAKIFEINFDEVAGNTPFTTEEQKKIMQKLQELEQKVRTTYSLSSEQMQVLDAKINYLVIAAGRLGRTDWRGLFASVILGYALTVAIPSETARAMFQNFIEVFWSIGDFFEHGFLELPHD